MPDSPDPQAGDQRVKVLNADELEEVLPINKFTRVGIKRCHCERERGLIFNRTVILVGHLLVVNAVKQHKPVRHQDVEP